MCYIFSFEQGLRKKWFYWMSLEKDLFKRLQCAILLTLQQYLILHSERVQPLGAAHCLQPNSTTPATVVTKPLKAQIKSNSSEVLLSFAILLKTYIWLYFIRYLTDWRPHLSLRHVMMCTVVQPTLKLCSFEMLSQVSCIGMDVFSH